MGPESTLAWILFNIFVLIMLAIDLFLHRKDHTVGMKEALIWSAIWTVVALAFNVFVYYWLGSKAALEFFTGYLIERSLSVDNLFVFLLVFSYFSVPSQYQRKVLFWGIFGALVMRALFIAAGLTLIQNFKWVIYVFGAFLVYTGIKMATHDEKEIHPEKNVVIRLFRKLMPVTPNYVDGKFFIKENGRRLATPLFIVLLVVETTDVVFAVDSIPAILAITLDPFIVYSSNVFAILGLRALYFAIAGLIQLFHHLNYGLSVILIFVGIKMLVSSFYHIPSLIALGVIALILTLSIVASLIWPKPPEKLKEEIEAAKHTLDADDISLVNEVQGKEKVAAGSDIEKNPKK
jgi:tellurite resistance protein TerC